MSNQDEKKTPAETDARLDSFTERRNRIYAAIGEVVIPGPDTTKENELEYLCCGVSAQFLALEGSAYAFKMCKLISEDAYEAVKEALAKANTMYREAVQEASALREADQITDPEPPSVH